jgi:hypothetical protein
LREAFSVPAGAPNSFSPEEQRAISNYIMGLTITPALEAELASLIRQIPALAALA